MKNIVFFALLAAIGTAHAEFDLGASLQKSFDKALIKNGLKQADATPPPAAKPSAVAQATPGAVLDGELVGKVYKNPYEDLAKSFKIARGLSFGAPGKMVLAFDLSGKSGRRVLALKQRAAEQWVVTGDMAVTAATTGLVFVGTTEEDESGEGDPKTTCSVAGKTVQGFGFLKASKKKFEQPAGGIAWTVDGNGNPVAATGLACKF